MKRLITLILAIALCVPLYIPVQAEFRYDLSEYSLLLNIKDVYPIQPGTEEWKKLETLQSKIAACEIPKETLHQMSTESLIEAVLYYPLFSNMYAYDSIEEGFDAVLQYCDALQELQRRDDAADALAARYKNTYSNQNADVLASSTELMHMTYMQMQKHTEKRKNQTLLLIEPFFNQLDEADKLYLCESIAVLSTNQTNATDGTASIVQTPNGTVLKEGWYDDYYITTSSGFSDDEIYYLDLEMARLYPNAIRRKSASKRYNCHSYAWHDQSPENNVWLINPFPYMTDGSYLNAGSAAAGRKVFYRNTGSEVGTDGKTLGDHSGIVKSVGSTIMVTSKWGEYGLYEHTVTDVNSLTATKRRSSSQLKKPAFLNERRRYSHVFAAADHRPVCWKHLCANGGRLFIDLQFT